MSHDLIVSPFLDGYLCLRPGSSAGIRLPETGYEELSALKSTGAPAPSWFRSATWVRQTRPGGIVLTTLAPGSWAYGTGLAKVTVHDDGTAEGRIIGESSFMQARSQAVVPLAGDLSARTAYADSEREAKVEPTLLEEWMPAFLAQLAAPGAQLVRAAQGDGTQRLYVFDADRESFAAFTENGSGWTVRQGGPVALWDDIERTLIAWQDAERPDISTVRLRVTLRSHTYWIGDRPALRWEHRLG